MEFLNIDIKKNNLKKIKILPDYLLKDYEEDFKIRFAHHSTAIEGNTLSLIETKLILDDKISVGGKPMREIYEVENFAKAYEYIKECVNKGVELNEYIIKNIHQIVMENILPGGIYRSHDVYIKGSQHEPPNPQNAYYQLKDLFNNFENKKIQDHPIVFASYVHAEFVKIHPFIDGNGRTARLILNYILLENGYRPILIQIKDKNVYYNCLEDYSVKGELKPFVNFIGSKVDKELNRYIRIAEQRNKTIKKNNEIEMDL